MIKELDDSLSEEQIDCFRRLRNNNDFKLYLALLHTKFNREYKKLRKCSRDKTYDKLNGFLDAIEMCETIVDKIVAESHNPDTGTAKE